MKTKLFLLCLLSIHLCITTAAQQIPSVRVIYLVSADRQARSDYKEAIEMAIVDIQQWYRQQMDGRTFRLNEPVVEVLKSNQPAKWFTGTPIPGVSEGDWGIQHTVSEVRRLLSDETIPGTYTWVLYSDGPGSSGRGGGQICYLPEDDFLGLTGRHPTQPDISRWIAGLGHEIGHAFGLPHPSDTDKDADAIMWTGIYGKYPDQTYLTVEDKKHLSTSPFFMTDREIADRKVSRKTVYSYAGGSFIRNQTKGGKAFWIENANDGSQYQFEETRNDGKYYYAFGRSVVTLKIPMNGGISFYSADDGNNWNQNHSVTLSAEQDVDEAEGQSSNSTTPNIRINPVKGAAILSPCQEPGNLLTEGAGDDTKINFVNKLPETVQLFWINYEKEAIPYATLQPNEKITQNTFTNHWWMAKTMNDECIGIIKNGQKVPIAVNVERKVKSFRLHTVDESELKKN